MLTTFCEHRNISSNQNYRDYNQINELCETLRYFFHKNNDPVVFTPQIFLIQQKKKICADLLKIDS